MELRRGLGLPLRPGWTLTDLGPGVRKARAAACLHPAGEGHFSDSLRPPASSVGHSPGSGAGPKSLLPWTLGTPFTDHQTAIQHDKPMGSLLLSPEQVLSRGLRNRYEVRWAALPLPHTHPQLRVGRGWARGLCHG
jgi:hypothetical protein